MDPSNARRRSLVVDDEALIRWSVGETLAEKGHTVSATDTAAGAVRLASGSDPFDVILLDLRLPDSKGLELLERLRAISPASKIIVMSAFGTPALVERARGLGVSGFLAKPFRLQELVEAVESV